MKKVLKWKWVIGGALAIGVVALLALWLVPQFITPNAPFSPTLSYFPTQSWRTSTMEEQGFDSRKTAEALQAIRDNHIPVHSLMLIRNGTLMLDAYFYPYDDATYHDFASVTKSVMTTLIGIAATQGRLNPDAPLMSFFPERSIANRDARKEKITVRQLASLSSGLECSEQENEKTLREMWAADDWVQFALNRPAVRDADKQFVYCSPDMHLLSAVLQQATGQTALEFARVNLFEPLGIRQVYWTPDPQGYSRGWGDLALHPRDAAKIGLLFLNQGQWDGKQIVSPEWIRDATTAHFSGTGRQENYGYGWWVSPPDEEPQYFLAAGRNGQRIEVIPAWNIIVVTTGGGFEYDQIAPYLAKAIGDLSKPLPANPAGVEQLAKTVAEVKQSPAAQFIPPLPQTARAISGKRFVLAPNSLSLKATRLDFDAPAEAVFTLEFSDDPVVRVTRVGLDGVYRYSRTGKPVIARGRWLDEQTFVVEYSEGPGLTPFTLNLRFNGNRVVFEIVGSASIEGTFTEY